MKKYILPALAAFLLACLIGGGTIRHLERRGKIRLEWDPTATAIKTRSIDRVIRELIPDSGRIYGKWEVLARQEDPVEWEYAENLPIAPRFGKVQLVWNDGRPIPGDWNILLKSYDDEGYKSFGISHDSIFDIEPGILPIQLQEGEKVELIPIEKDRQLPFVNKKAHYELYSVRLNGKAPAQLLVEWPGENNGHTLSIYGEVANIEELWDPQDDVFGYDELKKFEQPNFNGESHTRNWRGDVLVGWGDFEAWLEETMEPVTTLYESILKYPPLFGGMETNFIIEKNGFVTNINSRHYTIFFYGASREPSGEQFEIIEKYKKLFNSYVLQSNGKWKPGKIHGKPVRTRYELKNWSD